MLENLHSVTWCKINKQAKAAIINGACQSAGINTDEEQLMETWPHYHTAYGTHLSHQEEGCKLNQDCFRTSRAGRTKDSLGLCQQVAGTRKDLMFYALASERRQLQALTKAAGTKAQLLSRLRWKKQDWWGALLWERSPWCAL